MATEAPLLAVLPQLQALLDHYILPQLSVHDLGRLACVSSALRQALASISCTLWSTAASRWLPPNHPALQQREQAGLKAALADVTTARRNIRQGAYTERKLVAGAMSPDGRTHARVHAHACNGSHELHLTAIDLLHGGDATENAVQPKIQPVPPCTHLLWLDEDQLMLSQPCLVTNTVHVHIYRVAALALLAEAVLPKHCPGSPLPHNPSNDRYLAMRKSLRCLVIYDLSSLEPVRELQIAAPVQWGFRWHPQDLQRMAYLDSNSSGRITSVRTGSEDDTILHIGRSCALGAWSANGELLSVKVREGSTSLPTQAYMSCIILSAASGAAVLRLPAIGEQHCFSPDSGR